VSQNANVPHSIGSLLERDNFIGANDGHGSGVLFVDLSDIEIVELQPASLSLFQRSLNCDM
jgi:hypothetical protein